MRKYELLPHTADVRIYASADSIEELFKAALEGLCELILPGYRKSPHTEIISAAVSIESVDLSALAVDFLSEALFFMYSQRAIFNRSEFSILDEIHLSAVLYGFHIEEFANDVKAVSYHGAEIRQNKSGEFELTFVPDI